MAAPAPVAAPAPAPVATARSQAKAAASFRRIVASYGAQMALAGPTNGGLRVAAGGPGIALGLHGTWTLPRGLRLRPRVDYTLYGAETRTSAAFPLAQSLDTRVSSLGLGADLLAPLGSRWGLGLGVSGVRWSVASTHTITSAQGGGVSVAGTAHWTRLGLGPVVTFQVSDHLQVEARSVSSHYGYQNQPATTAAIGLLWRF